MARSRASWLALALLGGTVVQAAGPELDQSAPIKLDAHSTDIDYKNNKLAFHSVRITQGSFAIEADNATATGLDFKASHWVFTGNVRITMPDGSLTSDEARIEFVADAIANAQITGAPAAFEQKRDKRIARGHALHIDYDFAAATVRLRDQAELTDGEREISGQTLVYDMRQQRLRAGTTADDQNGPPVTFVITPKKPEPKPNP
jgi:lipopolysaccharide transport protein LptA